MGTITGNIEIIQHGADDLFIGDNEFESGLLSLAAAASAKDGWLLKRSSGKFVVAAAADITAGAVFVLATPDTITNSTEASVDYAVRVCVAGKVNRGKVTISDTALTDAQADMLRASGIIAQVVTSIGEQDNH